MDKVELRKKIKTKTLSVSSEQRFKISQKLSSNIATFLKEIEPNQFIINKTFIAGFVPLKDEFEWYLDPFFKDLKLALPHVLSETDMDFYSASFEDIRLRQFNINSLGAKKILPSIFLVPGIAFGKSGERLGRGKGYYDRYLAKKNCLKVGVCSEEQVLDELICEAHDELMDLVITDKKIYRVRY